jgi:hypothetical protein
MALYGLVAAAYGLWVAVFSAMQIEFETVGRRAMLSTLGLTLFALGVMLI